LDCGTQHKFYKDCCDGTKLGPDGKKVVEIVDGQEKPVKCKSTRREVVHLNGGWGTLIGVDETEYGYAQAALGFA